MATIGEYEQDASVQGRFNSWRFAFNLAVHSPFVGGGFNAFTRELFFRYAPEPDNFHDAHSIYFQVLGEHGFVGLGLFLSMLGFCYVTGSRIKRLGRGNVELKWAYDLASALQASLVAYSIGGAFLGMAYYDLFYHLVALTALTMKVSKKALLTASESTTNVTAPLQQA